MARASYFRFHDGGRAAAGYRGRTGDCVVRSIAIATGLPYQHIYDMVNRASTRERTGTRKRGISNARTGVYKSTIPPRDEGTRLDLDADDADRLRLRGSSSVRASFPSGRLVVSVSKHLTAMIDGIIHDTHDCSRRGRRCVYGYWQPPAGTALSPRQAEFFARHRTQSQAQKKSASTGPLRSIPRFQSRHRVAPLRANHRGRNRRPTLRVANPFSSGCSACSRDHF